MAYYSVRVLKEINYGWQIEINSMHGSVIADFYAQSSARKLVFRKGGEQFKSMLEAQKEEIRQQLIDKLEELEKGKATVELSDFSQEKDGRKKIKLFSDGGSAPNPGPGGWGVVVVFPEGDRLEKGGYVPATTNNRMELTGVIRGLRLIDESLPTEVWVDSTYVKNGITSWIEGWKKKGWRTAAGQPVKNSDLWQELEKVVAGRDLSWHWVRGHSGHPENERCDQLVQEARQRRSDI